jgi:hypothetical protein
MRKYALMAALACACAGTGVARAQDVPPLPPLTEAQAADVRQNLDAYRAETHARVARGEILPDDAERLLRWREWQLAQQAAGLAPPPTVPTTSEPPVTPPYAAAPYYPPRAYYGAPYYRPYPYYYGAPVYFGASICAGGVGHNFAGRICI